MEESFWKNRFAILGLLLILLLSSCQLSIPVPAGRSTPIPSYSPEPTGASTSRPTRTSLPTLTPMPTHTPGPTRTPAPSRTPLPITPGPSTSQLVEALFEMPVDVQEASWAPEGQVLAMATSKQAFLARGPAFEMQAVVTFTRPLGSDLYGRALFWSPDGVYLLPCDLWAVTVPELTSTLLLSNTCDGNWSPDGRSISFLSLGRPLLNEEKQLVGIATDPTPGPSSAYLGVLDLASRQVLVSLPFPFDPDGYYPWEYYVGFWSPDSRLLLATDPAGRMYLWRRGDAQATMVYYDSSLIFGTLPFSADSDAFIFRNGNRGWVARVKR